MRLERSRLETLDGQIAASYKLLEDSKSHLVEREAKFQESVQKPNEKLAAKEKKMLEEAAQKNKEKIQAGIAQGLQGYS